MRLELNKTLYKLYAVFVIGSEIPALGKVVIIFIAPLMQKNPNPFQIKAKIFVCSDFFQPF